ncbi:hypothetical protein CAter282_3177 [Collimonas arenae]|uniref:Uncharacterized protein n=1 Tax=Collimonas arenae TaxID=279058 RepID=A0A127PTE6_9BURK|nr:hypothetical protein CAter10_3486 [Collimonas arenae]AMP10882.1 hypothetical protein CAter282_3177 [Collimonas arenae]
MEDEQCTDIGAVRQPTTAPGKTIRAGNEKQKNLSISALRRPFQSARRSIPSDQTRILYIMQTAESQPPPFIPPLLFIRY